MTESRIPKVLANRVWLTFAHHPGASGLHCMRAALDAHLDELAALVQPDQGGVWVVIAEEETYGERKRVQVWVPDAKAVPAPELPAADHVCDSGNFDRTVCGCGAMHSYCGTCGKRADECDLDAQAEPSPDALPRPITREEMREGQVVERATTVRYRVGPATTGYPALSYHSAQSGWSLVADAPDPDSALVDALAEAIAADDGRPLETCAEESVEQYRGNARAVLAALRERCDITPRGER